MEYDVIIVGSGPAGISASLYTKRANLKTLIVSEGIGTLEKVQKIDNYYGIESGKTGKDLYYEGINQAKNLGVEIIKDEVLKIDYDNKFIVETINNEYTSKTVILATGSSRKNTNIKGIKELEGKGISYCATCDAFFYRGKNVGVLGSSQYTIREAEELKNIVGKITIYTNGENIIENRSQEFQIDERKIKEFRGTNSIEEIQFEDNNIEKIDGIFIAIGVASSSDLARKIGAKTDKNNNIVVDENMKTNIPGLYACGDCTGGQLQIAKAVYEGMCAGMSVIKRVRNLDN